MNAKIEELKQKAYVSKDGEFCFDGGKVEILDVNLFAELLILKCAEVAYDTHDDFSVKLNIIKYFGVKE